MTAWRSTPPMRPAASHVRSRRKGRRRRAARKVTPTTTVMTTVTSRLPNSTRAWKCSGGVRCPVEQLGQSAQPSPDPVRRTAAPLTTIRVTTTSESTQRRRKTTGETVGRRVARPGPPGWAGSATTAQRTGDGPGVARQSRPGPTRPPAVGSSAMASEAPALGVTRARWSPVHPYIALTKPRIIELLLVTTLPTMIVAKRGVPPVWLMAATLIGGALAAGGANAINMYVDRDIDRLMHRTRKRPLVTGAVTPRAALTFAITLEVLAFAELWGLVNLLSAVLAVSATLFYVFVYTMWLKRRSTQNIVIGGAAGAVPVLVGWAAVTDTLAWAPVVMFAVIFIWTPPHFWSLAVRYKEDYRAADVPMLPVVASMKRTTTEIVYYTVALVAVSFLFGPVAHLGWIYMITAAVLGAGFLYLVTRLWGLAQNGQVTGRDSMKVFGYSITYLTVLFVAMAGDVLISNHIH